MLTTSEQELIASAVDGEVSTSEQRALLHLLHRSSKARALLQELQSHQERLRSLPQAAPPEHLRNSILAIITKLTTKSKAPPVESSLQRPKERAVARWIPVAIAASILIAITAGSFAYFSDQPAGRQNSPSDWTHALPAQQNQQDGSSPIYQPKHLPKPGSGNVVRDDALPIPSLPVPKDVPPREIAIAPEPRPVLSDPLLASPVWPRLPPFDRVQVRVPFLRSISDLEREDIRAELVDELKRDPAFRVDLFVRDVAHGITVLRNAAKASGLSLIVDATTNDRIAKKHATIVMVYTDHLTATELAGLFGNLASEDTKFSPRVCDTVHATPIARGDELELRAILGMDPGLFRRQVPNEKAADPKPLSADTIDSLTKTLTTPAQNAAEKSAILLTWHPAAQRTNPQSSAELKQFLSKRGDRRPDAVPVIIVIRPIN